MGQDLHCCVDPEGKDSYSALSSPPSLKQSKSHWTEQGKIELDPGSSFGQPLMSGDDIIFISSSNNNINVVTYNMKTAKFGPCDEIKCVKDIPFDIDKCQYTFDAKQKLIYFVNNNRDIMTLDLKTKKLVLNESITPNETDFAHIEKVKNKIYILGATKGNNYDEKVSDDNFVYAPYDAFKMKGDEEKQQNKEYSSIQGFGSRAVSINITIEKQNYILIMGGEKEHEVIDEETKQSVAVQAPCDLIWCLNVSLIDKPGDFKDKWKKRFLHRSMTSFGIINYKNKYIITFGGFVYDSKTEKKKKFFLSDKVYALDLNSQHKQWYILNAKLPQKSGYFAVYQDETKDVHLFAWNGRHYTMKIEQIIKPLEKKQCITVNQLWTEQGKTVLPTKSKSIRSMGPKIAEDEEADKK